jgi:catechol 2,3-dioxygenase-like lactoylglutathione lyase family enzyme
VPDIDNVNHVGMAVRDLESAVAIFERMGFQLTPYSPHSGAWKPNEAVRSFGSGNRCIMFEHDYLEILGSENPQQQSPRIAGFLARHQGGHIICFNSEDIHAVDRRLQAAGVTTSGVIPLQREISTAEGVRTAKFERVQFGPDASPEGYIQAARHLTPQYIYQPRYIEHPNGCTQLSETILVVDDLERYAEKYKRYLELPAKREDDTVTFTFALGSRLRIVSARGAPTWLPSSLLPPYPSVAGVAFRAKALQGIRRRLVDQGFAFSEANGRLIVPAEQASGLAIVFEG